MPILKRSKTLTSIACSAQIALQNRDFYAGLKAKAPLCTPLWGGDASIGIAATVPARHSRFRPVYAHKRIFVGVVYLTFNDATRRPLPPERAGPSLRITRFGEHFVRIRLTFARKVLERFPSIRYDSSPLAVTRNGSREAQMAELVDALGSGPSGGNTVEVRVLFWAPIAGTVIPQGCCDIASADVCMNV
jgi:hypothetical protein